MRFRPCIDLHQGQVKQIVGGTLRDEPGSAPVTNFVAAQSPAYFARLYRGDGLLGGHVIRLGPGNDAAAGEALVADPGGLQLGGGIDADNAATWLAHGAAKVIVTSWLFDGPRLSPERLRALSRATGPERLVIDLSCRRSPAGAYVVATNRWQTLTDLTLSRDTFARLAEFAGEFLVHAVDVEGKQQGIDEALVALLAAACPLPVTYAGGVRHLADLDLVERAGGGRVDATVGSALDIFGGTLPYADVVAWDRRRREPA